MNSGDKFDSFDETSIRIPSLKLQLEQAQTYSEWHAAAAGLDEIEGHDAWKLEDECSEYDVSLIRAKLREMDDIRLERDQRKMLSVMREGLARNLGGMGSLRLYKHSRVGTKALIERYIQSVLDTVDVLVDITKTGHGNVDSAVALQELLYARQAFGRSALLLSGGGTFGMNHIGVVKALFEAKLLPRIISGASAGSIVSAVLCSKTDDEIPAVLNDFCHGDLAVFEKEGQETGIFKKAYRFMTQGSLFDIANLSAVMRDLLGDLTFAEAYNRTRRILNICVSAANHFEMPRLLNYLTAPDVMIWSAVAASCSVPFIFSPGQLLVKDRRTGKHVPWNSSARRWIDGSVENDIPTQRLAEMFNVNHFIVSQVNPHVVPFLDKDEKDLEKEAERKHAAYVVKPTLAHKLSTVARDEAMHRLHVIEELGIFPNLFSKVRAVVGQRYAGDITIFPQISYANFPYVLSNPDTAFMIQATLSGEKATWPKLSEIRNHCSIELAIDDAVHELIPHHVFGPVQLD
ncbi:putative esterase of the alpha-beta hydrolase superfamily, partial [Myriangium duriaei CBS 260.36]